MKRQILSSLSLLVMSGLICEAPAYAGMYVSPEKRYSYHNHHHHGGSVSYHSSHRYYPFAKERKATGKPVFIFNPRSLSWGAYNGSGELVKVGPASGGRGYCPDVGRGCHTPVGVFHVYQKEGPSYVSKKFPVGEGGAPMPYAMFFRGGFAVHGSHEVRDFNASHGCIRITPADAQWLNRTLLTYGSTVIVMPY